MSEHQFTCKDGAGSQHRYMCERHRGGEGMVIAMQLAAMVVEPLSAVVGPAIVQRIGGAPSLADFDLESIDFGVIGTTLRGVLTRMPPLLIYQVLLYTNRDDKPLIDSTVSPTLHFDEAYAGNYLEIGRAVWEVCKINAFFPGLASLETAGKLALSAERGTAESEA